MWSTELFSDRQILEIRFAGRVTAADAQLCAARIEELLPQLQPGFCLLTDLTDLEEMTLDCGPVLARMMDAFSKRGIGRVVRVIPNPSRDIGFGILSLFHYGPTVRVITCDTMTAAKSHLPAPL